MTDTISIQNMHFTVIHHHPKYPEHEKQSKRAEIEQQLFEIFKQYA